MKLRVGNLMKKIDGINITPLVDVLLVLLVILILLIPAFSKVIPVNIPTASTEQQRTDNKIIQLDIHANGYIYYDNGMIALTELQKKLPKGKRITLAIDKNTAYDKISPVLERLNMMQYEQVDFMVK